MDELTIIRGDKPDGGGGWSRTISAHTAFLFIHKYLFRKVNKLVIFYIQ